MGSISGYLLTGASSLPGQAAGEVPGGRLTIRLPTVFVWLDNGMSIRRAPSGREWLKRGLLRSK
jgi:hypothetical protein